MWTSGWPRGTRIHLNTEDQSFSETDSAFRLVVRRPTIPRKAVSQRMFPDLASMAKISCSPVVMYITPSLTTGVACCEKPGPKPELRRAIQAPFSVFTFATSICESVE